MKKITKKQASIAARWIVGSIIETGWDTDFHIDDERAIGEAMTIIVNRLHKHLPTDKVSSTTDDIIDYVKKYF